jgi:hypothetical protein
MSEQTPVEPTGQPDATGQTATAAPAVEAAGPRLGDTLRALVIASCVAAAVVHFAYAPAHFDEGAVHGAFFLVVAWAQLVLAFALARWREARWPWVAVVGVNAAVAGVWLISRTAGVPGSDAEPVGFPDGLATGLEVAAVVGALVALRPSLAMRPVGRVSPVLGGVAALALMGVVSASVTPSLAGDHDHADGHARGEEAAGADHSGGHHGDAQALAGVDDAERCDLGFNTAAYNDAARPGMPHHTDDTEGVDFTLEEWADVFVDPEGGLPASVVVDFIEQRPALREGIMGGSLTHTLEPDPWNPLSDPDQCAALADELARAKAVAERHPTIADAEAAGYQRVTTYLPGIAAHYMNFENLQDGFVLEEPEMLLYDGDGPDASIVGLSYYILHDGDEEPAEGFTGDNDHYHRHVGLCIRDGVVAAGSGTSEEDCEALGGRKSDGASGWMSHVWIAPGCESDWGVFSGANPRLSVRAPGDTSSVPPGCGTGKAIDDDLAFDTRGEGPAV